MIILLQPRFLRLLLLVSADDSHYCHAQTYVHADGSAAKVTFLSRHRSSHRPASRQVFQPQRGSMLLLGTMPLLALCTCAAQQLIVAVYAQHARALSWQQTVKRNTCMSHMCPIGSTIKQTSHSIHSMPLRFSSRRRPYLQVHTHIVAHHSGGGLAACHVLVTFGTQVSALGVSPHPARGADDTHRPSQVVHLVICIAKASHAHQGSPCDTHIFRHVGRELTCRQSSSEGSCGGPSMATAAQRCARCCSPPVSPPCSSPSSSGRASGAMPPSPRPSAASL